MDNTRSTIYLSRSLNSTKSNIVLKYLLRHFLKVLFFFLITTFARGADMPPAFQNLSRLQSYSGCSMYFDDMVKLTMDSLKNEPDDRVLQMLLRQFVTDRTQLVLLAPSDELTTQQSLVAYKAMMAATKELKSLEDYCETVSKNFPLLVSEGLSSKTARAGFAKNINDELRDKLRSVGAKNWRNPS